MSSSRTAVALATAFAWGDRAVANWATYAMAHYYHLFDANREVRAFPALLSLPQESENHLAAGWERVGWQVREMDPDAALRGIDIVRRAPAIVAPMHHSRRE